jgi:hypothetical protein
MAEFRWPASNEESWTCLVQAYDEYPDTPYWNGWRSTIAPLIDQCIRAGYNALFRAGMSMHHTVFSTLDHHRLKLEPRVTVEVTQESEIKIHYSTGNVWFSSPTQSITIPSSEAFPALTRYLQHLWTETVPEPIPEALRRKVTE